MKTLLIIIALSLNAFQCLAKDNDAKAASEFLMMHPNLIQIALDKLPSAGEKRCYPDMHYIGTTSEAAFPRGIITTYVFNYECKAIDLNVVEAQIKLIEKRFPDEPRDDYVIYDVQVKKYLEPLLKK